MPKRLIVLPILIALQPGVAMAAPTATAQTAAHYQFSIRPNLFDAYNSIGGDQSSSGVGTYSITPSQIASSGVGADAAGGGGSVEWKASVTAAPAFSMAQMDGAWLPNKDANGIDLPIFHLSNLTEFAVPIEIYFRYELAASGSVLGNAGVSALNQVGFHIDCSSCSGLAATDFGGSQALLAGSVYGGSDGAFGDTKANADTFRFSLDRFSDLGLFITARSSATLVANPSAAAVPEPATWAMAILGFGVIGGAMRQRRRPAALPA